MRHNSGAERVVEDSVNPAASLGSAAVKRPERPVARLRASAARDNSALFTKLLLRKRFTADVQKADIFLAACGCGVMFAQAWREKARYVLALDTAADKVEHIRQHNPAIDARVGDIVTFDDWPQHAGFTIADFDVFGSPYKAILNFLRSSVWRTPLYVIVTDGIPLWLGRGGFLPAELVGERKAARVRDPEARRRYMEAMVWPWWSDVAGQSNLVPQDRVALWKKGKTIVYYAIKLVRDCQASASR